MSLTYQTLAAQIAQYLDRTDADTLSQIPTFIYNAQQRLSREALSVGLETYVTGAFTPGLAVYPKPALWRAPITFNCGLGATNNSRSPIQLRSYEYCLAYSNDRTQTGIPQYYSDYGYDDYFIAPTPNAAYPFEIAFLGLPPVLTPLYNQNFWTNFAPDVLLYACLVETAPYLKDDERIAMWNSEYQTRIASFNSQDKQRVHDRSSNRSAD